MALGCADVRYGRTGRLVQSQHALTGANRPSRTKGESMKSFRAALPMALALGAAGLAQAQPTVKPDGQFRAVFGLGASLASGNTEANNLSFTFDGVRATATGKTTLYARGNYASTDGETTAEQWRLGGRHDHVLSAATFTFGGLDLEQNKFTNLRLRGQLNGGLGWHVVRSQQTTFNVLAGAGYTSDSYYEAMLIDGAVRSSYDYANLLLREESTHQLTESTSAQQRLTVTPNVSQWGEYRANWDGSLAVAINKTMNLTVGLSLAYNSEPGPGRQTTDTLFTTGISVKFD